MNVNEVLRFSGCSPHKLWAEFTKTARDIELYLIRLIMWIVPQVGGSSTYRRGIWRGTQQFQKQ